MARRVGAAESEATSAKRREAIYSGKVSDWPGSKDKVSTFSCGNSMNKVKTVLLVCAALRPPFKAIYDKVEAVAVMNASPMIAQDESYSNESWNDWASFDASCKSHVCKKDMGYELAGATQPQTNHFKRLSMGKTAVDMHKVKEIIDAMVMTKVFASAVDEIDISVLLWSPPEVNHKVVTNGMSTKGKTVETTMLRTPRLVVLAGAVRFVLGNMLHACTTCAWVKLQAMKAGVPDARVHTDEDEKEGARHC